MKKWRPPSYPDQVLIEHGIYVYAERPDEHGPRAFLTLNMVWEEAETTFLSDAATHWGMAPWALMHARESMRMRPLGTWDQFVAENALILRALQSASQDMNDSQRHGALLMVRSGLKLHSLMKGARPTLEHARHCLKAEISKDAAIRDAKAKTFAQSFPDWKAPARA